MFQEDVQPVSGCERPAAAVCVDVFSGGAGLLGGLLLEL